MGKNRGTAVLTVTVDYDPDITDGESIAAAMDLLMSAALSTHGILDDYGRPDIGQFFVDTDLGRKDE